MVWMIVTEWVVWRLRCGEYLFTTNCSGHCRRPNLDRNLGGKVLINLQINEKRSESEIFLKVLGGAKPSRISVMFPRNKNWRDAATTWFSGAYYGSCRTLDLQSNESLVAFRSDLVTGHTFSVCVSLIVDWRRHKISFAAWIVKWFSLYWLVDMCLTGVPCKKSYNCSYPYTVNKSKPVCCKLVDTKEVNSANLFLYIYWLHQICSSYPQNAV